MIDDVIITEVEGFSANENLPYYNAIKAVLNTDTILELLGVDVKTLDGKTFDVYNYERTTLLAENVSEYTIGLSTNCIIAKSNNTKILIKGKYYTLGRFSFVDNGSVVANRVPFDIGQLAYSDNLFYVNLPNRCVDIEGELDVSTLKKIKFFFCEVLTPNNVRLLIPDGTELLDLVEFSYFRRFSGANAGLKVDIITFAPSKKLTNLILNNNTGVTGNLNNLLDALYDSGNGKVSGNLRIELLGTSCTYNGNPITTTPLNFTFSSSGWTQV